MSMVGFPFLLIPLAIYNILVFLMPGVDLAAPLFTLPLTSGAQWPVTSSDILLALAILMLLCEVVKGARPGAKFLTDHLLSLLILGGAIAEFLLWPRFANSTFFLLVLLTLVDFLSGVAQRVRRGVPAVVTSARSRGRIEPEVRHEPQKSQEAQKSQETQESQEGRGLRDLHAGVWPPAHAPASQEPADHAPANHEPITPASESSAPSKPVVVHPVEEPAAHVPEPAPPPPVVSPEVPSPDLQPGDANGAPRPPETPPR
jgi:hypothetical protein